ncbi:MAG: PP2C family protein-serine/threonine phosphatase [Butyrivibrio sp.]|nr:PP2C family protein-serine/threonine phosphatase [Butyrivibrio sp.]
MTETVYISKRIQEQMAKRKWSSPACFVSSLVLTIFLIGVCKIRGFDGLPNTVTLSIGADVVSLMICTVLLYSCIRQSDHSAVYVRTFILLITLNAFVLFFDALAWLVEGIPYLRIVNLVDNVLLYASSATLIYLFWQYIRIALELDSPLMEGLNLVLNILFIPNILSCFVNLFYPLFFTVNENGNYSRTDIYMWSQTYLAIALVFIVIGFFTSRVSVHERLVVASFVLIPIFNQVYTGYAYGMSTQYAAMLVSIVLMYGVLFSDRERKLAATEDELSLATRIQSAMLPSIFPAFPEKSEFEVYASMNPAKEVGGDFYDFYLVDEDHLALLIADVSGKGVPAALFMMASKILLQNYTMLGMSPGKVLDTANRAICSNNKEDMFVTVWLGILDIKTGVLTASNAGHEYPIFMKNGHDFELYKDKHGFVVGGMDGVKYSEYQIQMEKGDKLFLYTDGVAEATNRNKELFGTERTIAALNQVKDKTPKDILQKISESIDGFVNEAPQFDDITMVCLEYKK